MFWEISKNTEKEELWMDLYLEYFDLVLKKLRRAPLTHKCHEEMELT